jgi:hypothetical protein
MICGNLNLENTKICDCGSKNFVFGYNFTYTNKTVKCNCGNDEFIMTFHLNNNPIYTKNYQCTKCKNIIGMQTYYKSPYLDE